MIHVFPVWLENVPRIILCASVEARKYYFQGVYMISVTNVHIFSEGILNYHFQVKIKIWHHLSVWSHIFGTHSILFVFQKFDVENLWEDTISCCVLWRMILTRIGNLDNRLFRVTPCVTDVPLLPATYQVISPGPERGMSCYHIQSVMSCYICHGLSQQWRCTAYGGVYNSISLQTSGCQKTSALCLASL